MNDSSVNSVNLQNIKSTKPYMMFYYKKEKILEVKNLNSIFKEKMNAVATKSENLKSANFEKKTIDQIFSSKKISSLEKKSSEMEIEDLPFVKDPELSVFQQPEKQSEDLFFQNCKKMKNFNRKKLRSIKRYRIKILAAKITKKMREKVVFEEEFDLFSSKKRSNPNVYTKQELTEVI